MEKYIKTATGKEFEVTHCAATTVGMTSVLYMRFPGRTLIEMANVMAQPEETKLLCGYIDGELKKQYKNYTNLIEAYIHANSGDVHIALTADSEEL